MAVLPFADLSPQGDQEYFSDGIAEEILNVLVGVDGLDIELLQQAVTQDPSFAKAWEMLAATTNLLGEYGPTDDTDDILDLRAAL